MKISELRKKVNEAVKSLGLTKNDVSISVRVSRYSNKIETYAKHDKVDLKQLHQTLKTFKYVDRCEKSGEILAGGNTYVFVHDAQNRCANWSDFSNV